MLIGDMTSWKSNLISALSCPHRVFRLSVCKDSREAGRVSCRWCNGRRWSYTLCRVPYSRNWNCSRWFPFPKGRLGRYWRLRGPTQSPPLPRRRSSRRNGLGSLVSKLRLLQTSFFADFRKNKFSVERVIWFRSCIEKPAEDSSKVESVNWLIPTV